MLAFSGGFIGNLLKLVQTADDGNVVVKRLAAGSFTVSDGAGSQQFGSVDSLSIGMIDGTENELKLELLSKLPDNLSIDLGTGDREFVMTGDSDVSGDIVLVAGAGEQRINWAPVEQATYGDTSIDSGLGIDIFAAVDSTFSSLTLTKVGNSALTNSNVGSLQHNPFAFGNNSITFSGSTLDGLLNVQNTSVFGSTTSFNAGISMANANIVVAQSILDLDGSAVSGDVSYSGGNRSDRVTMSASQISGDLFVDAGEGETDGTHRVQLENMSIAGDVTLLSNPTQLTSDVASINIASIGGDLIVNLGGGLNDSTLVANVLGDNLTYRSRGVDASSTLHLDVTAPNAFVNVVLDSSDDTVVLAAPNPLNFSAATLRIDFGGGQDSFENTLMHRGITFDTRFVNLNGFRVFGSPGNNSTLIQQFELPQDNSVPVVVGNVSTSSDSPSFQLSEGAFVSAFSPSDSLRVLMLDDSQNPLQIQLDWNIRRILTVNLGDGVRELDIVNSTGNARPVDASARIIGGTNGQTVRTTGKFGTNFLTSISLGESGQDFFEPGDDVETGGSLNLIGGNIVENTHTIDVGFNLLVQNEIGIFIRNSGTISVGNDFTLFGGHTNDQIRLNHDVSVGGDTFFNLNEGTTTFNSQSVEIGDSNFAGNFTLVASGDASVSVFTSILARTATFQSDLTINFSNVTNSGNSSNNINLFGEVAGSVNVRGGQFGDAVAVIQTGSESDVRILTGGGADSVFLLPNTEIDSLFVNFGDGVDSYIDNFPGSEPFDVTLVNLP